MFRESTNYEETELRSNPLHQALCLMVVDRQRSIIDEHIECLPMAEYGIESVPELARWQHALGHRKPPETPKFGPHVSPSASDQMPAVVPDSSHFRSLRTCGSRGYACGVWRLADHGVECDGF
jgi:hypothetical protein